MPLSLTAQELSVASADSEKPMRVLNHYRDRIPEDAVNIQRGTEWGNPFVIGVDGDRETVLRLFDQYLEGNPKLVKKAKRVLLGHDLVCCCVPKRCHGHIWLKHLGQSEVKPVGLFSGLGSRK